MKKILYILEATEGGTRRHLDDLVRGLDRSRYEPVVACALRRDAAFAESVELMRRQRVRVHEVDMCRHPAPATDFTAWRRLKRLLRDEKPDLVHTHSTKAGLLGRMAAREARRCPVVHTPHGFPFEMWTTPLRRRFYRAIERWALRMTDALVCVCPEEERIALNLGPRAANVVSMIPNGIDTTRPPCSGADALSRRAALDIPDNATVVGWVGRHCRQKGLPWLPEAEALLPPSRPSPVVFVLVGDGPDQNSLEPPCRELRLSERFRFVSATPYPRNYYGVFDVFVLPSLWEALPYTLLDALWAGLPVVASNVGGAGGLLDRAGAGLSVPPADAPALAQALHALLGDAETRKRYGADGHDYVATHHRLTDMIARTTTLYDTVLELNGQPRYR